MLGLCHMGMKIMAEYIDSNEYHQTRIPISIKKYEILIIGTQMITKSRRYQSNIGLYPM